MVHPRVQTTAHNDWFIADPTIGGLPWFDRMRMWAGLEARSLPAPLARQLQLASFRATVRVFTILSVLAGLATITITATMVPLHTTRGRWWAGFHAVEYVMIVSAIIWVRPRLERGTLRLIGLNAALLPPVVGAAILWGSLPAAVGFADRDAMYLATAVTAILGAFGFFWPFGDWPLSTIYGLIVVGTLAITFSRFDPSAAPMFNILAFLHVAALVAMSLLAAHGLIHSNYDSVVARDRQQFIDLLLRDQERGGLDFLWQTDDDLVLGPVPPRMIAAAQGDPRVRQGRSLLNLLDDPVALADIRDRRPFNTTITTSGPSGCGQIRLSGRPKPIGGDRVGYRGIGTDAATERRAAEAERIRERLDTMVTLTGGLAHDFNNQLATVLGAVELASLDPGISDHSTTLLSRAADACLRTRRITSDLVVASGHSITYDAAPFELTSAISQIIADVGPLHPGATITFVPSRPVWVDADQNQYMRSVRNLIENGCQAVLGPSQPADRPSVVRVVIEQDLFGGTEWATTVVRDTGPGLDEAHREMLFEPFFSTRQAVGGTGLGLSVVRGFAHQANGTVTAQNGEVGAEFRLTIPAVSPPSVVPIKVDEVGPSEYTPVIRGLVLIVEDDPNVAHNLRHLLEAFGARVEVVGSVGDAVSQFVKRVGDLECVISDIILPDGEGFEVIAAFRKVDPNLRAVYMSGFTRTLPSTVAPELRCPFLPKPFSTREFVDSMRLAGVGAPTASHQ